jgi:(p)ppGpp synthase/HD superfamily hydrolase
MPQDPSTYLGIQNKLERAISIAVAAHENQVDKGGNPYVLHPLRIMLSLETEEERIVGVLHDVIEDCSERGFDSDFIKACGFSQEIIDGLKSVTKTSEEEHSSKIGNTEQKEEAYLRFVSRAKLNAIGRNVKKADLIDNTDITRIARLKEKDLHRLNRYIRALKLLDE